LTFWLGAKKRNTCSHGSPSTMYFPYQTHNSYYILTVKNPMMTSTMKLAMRTIAATTLGMAALSFSTTSVAQESILTGWSGTANIGANTSKGNADAHNINGAIRLGKTIGRWEHVVFGTLFKGQSTLVVNEQDAAGNVVLDDSGRPVRSIVEGDTSDRLALGYQPKFYYTDRTFFFGILDWETDEPANIDQAFRQVIGVGHRFFSDDSGFLSAEIGVGNKNTEAVFGPDADGGIGYLGVNYLNRFNENTTFTADFRSDFGSDNTFIELGLGLSFRVSTNMSLKASYFARNNSDLSDATNPLNSSTDSVTSFQLVFDI